MRSVLEGDDLAVIFVPLWVDDVSGNDGKQYNKHINTYMQNSNLPGKLLNQEFFVCLVLSSQHATSPEQLAAILEMIKCVCNADSVR
jgi:hypothetical protein